MCLPMLLTEGPDNAVPALPVETKTCPTLGDWASFKASACSRAPPPSNRTFADILSLVCCSSELSSLQQMHDCEVIKELNVK